MFEALLPLKNLGKGFFLLPVPSLFLIDQKTRKHEHHWILTIETASFPVKLGPTRTAFVHSLIILPVHLPVGGVVRCPVNMTEHSEHSI